MNKLDFIDNKNECPIDYEFKTIYDIIMILGSVSVREREGEGKIHEKKIDSLGLLRKTLCKAFFRFNKDETFEFFFLCVLTGHFVHNVQNAIYINGTLLERVYEKSERFFRCWYKSVQDFRNGIIVLDLVDDVTEQSRFNDLLESKK